MIDEPKDIWLQIGDDDPHTFADENFMDLWANEEITWSFHKQYDSDIHYVHASRIAELEQENERLRKFSEALSSFDIDTANAFMSGHNKGLKAGMERALEIVDYSTNCMLAAQAISAEIKKVKEGLTTDN